VEVGLLVKGFFDGPVEEVLQRMAGPGGRRPATAEARGAASHTCLARAAAQNHNTWMWPALLGFVGCATFIVCCCCLAASYSDNSSTSRAEPRGPVRV
jgi:hypothetical protein